VRNDLVDYSQLKRSKELEPILEQLKRTSPDHIVDNNEQLAYWVNACNILELKVICDRYPTASVLRMGNVASSRRFIIGGKQYAIQDIYTSKVVPLARQTEPLAIFLVCQGAIGYPPLSSYAVTGATLSQDSQTAAYAFVNNSKNVYYEPTTNVLKISPYFEWTEDVYRKKFETAYDLVNHFLKDKIDLSEPALKKSTTLKFDWRINDTRWLQASQ
jgi:hypothetical protein